MIYVPEYFQIQELVYPEIYKANEKRLGVLWMAFDVRALRALDLLRKQYGPITVNNWKDGGEYRESGLRTFDTKTGANLSQHKFGRAFDCKFKHYPAEEVRQNVLKNTATAHELITRIEMGVSWFHFDTGNWNKQAWGICQIQP